MRYISDWKMKKNRDFACQLFPDFKKQIASLFIKAMCKPIDTVSSIVVDEHSKKFDLIEIGFYQTSVPGKIILKHIEAFGFGDEPNLVDWFVDRGFTMSDVPDVLKANSEPYKIAEKFESQPEMFYELVLEEDLFEMELFQELQEKIYSISYPQEFKKLKF